jgi:hypothetical protein
MGPMAEPAGLVGLPPQDQPWEDLLDGRAPRPHGELVAEMNHLLGIGPGYERPRPAGLPDTGSAADWT